MTDERFERVVLKVLFWAVFAVMFWRIYEIGNKIDNLKGKIEQIQPIERYIIKPEEWK